jgi:hypothetical protein
MSEVVKEMIKKEDIKENDIKLKLIKRRRKIRDEIVFCLNFILTFISVAIIFGFPNYFAKLNTIVFLIKYVHRIYEFYQYKWSFYLFDFCYFVNFTVIFFDEYFKNTDINFNLKTQEFLFVSLFGFTLGPILLSIFVFNYGFIFHNTLKFTSLWIHLAPGIVMFINRWHNKKYRKFINDLIFSYCFFSEKIENKTLKNFLSLYEITNLRFISLGFILKFFVECSKFYFFWFVIYYIIIFKISFNFANKNGYLTQFKASSESNREKKYLKVFGEGYEKIAFMFMHLRYVFLCISLSFLFLFSYHLTLLVFLICFLALVFNTSTYYIEYFSLNYEAQFEYNKDESTKKTPI